jgi:alpha-tubulin suppressor-like RCC1 family protein
LLTTPNQVGVEVDWLSVSAGESHTCGIRDPEQRRLLCWGNNDQQQLGVVNATVQPVELGAGWLEVSVAESYTCGVRQEDAMTPTVVCWGVPTPPNTGAPIAPTELEGSQGWHHVDAGALHACALDAEGHLRCFGRNASGQFGSGTPSEDIPPPPTAIVGGGDSFTWAALSVGDGSTCGVTAGDHALSCWGQNTYGQLGSGLGSLPDPTAVRLGP